MKYRFSSLLLSALFFSCVSCGQKKLIILPDNGDRTVVYTESGDTLKVINTTISIAPIQPVTIDTYQGEILPHTNYIKNSKNTISPIILVHDNLVNILVIDHILYYTKNEHLQHYDLQKKQDLKPLPFTIDKPALLSVKDGVLALVLNNILTVYDLKKDKVLFEKTLNNLITKRPLIKNQKIFVQTQTDDLICFDATSGDELWRYTHSKHETYIFQNDRSSGLATWENNIIFVAAGGDVVILDMETKEPHWVYPSTSVSELTLNTPFTPIVDGNKLYLAKKDTGLICLDLKERRLAWQRPSIQTYLAPCLYDKYLFVVKGNTLTAVEITSGKALYQAKLPQDIITTPFVQDGKLIVASRTEIVKGFFKKNLIFLKIVYS